MFVRLAERDDYVRLAATGSEAHNTWPFQSQLRLDRCSSGNVSYRLDIMAKAGARKKLPKEVAVINADNCTGCEACLEVCPVDCIVKVPGNTISVLQSFCEIDVERCVGCEVCVHIPTKKSDPYELTVCPWDAIEMLPTVQVAQYVAAKGGPEGYLRDNWDRIVEPAIRMAQLAAEQQA